MREVFCQKLQRKAAGLEVAPFPGALGERIYENISQEAWDNWLSQQTILVNENQLSLADAETRDFLRSKMREFLFAETT